MGFKKGCDVLIKANLSFASIQTFLQPEKFLYDLILIIFIFKKHLLQHLHLRHLVDIVIQSAECRNYKLFLLSTIFFFFFYKHNRNDKLL